MDIISSEDVNRTQGLILTEKCGHQKAIPIPSQTLDNLHRKFQKSSFDLKQANREKFSPQVLQKDDAESQMNRLMLSLQVSELKLLSEENAVARDSQDWEPTFESVKAYLLTEVDSHQALYFGKSNRLSTLRDEIEILKRNITQEEILIENSKGKSNVEFEKRKLTRRIQELNKIAETRSLKLLSLIDRFYPALTDEEVLKETGQRKKPKSMRKLIEALYRKTRDSQEDPEYQWMTIDNSIWRPYVNELIHCGIAKFHPEGSDRFAMIDFGQD